MRGMTDREHPYGKHQGSVVTSSGNAKAPAAAEAFALKRTIGVAKLSVTLELLEDYSE